MSQSSSLSIGMAATLLLACPAVAQSPVPVPAMDSQQALQLFSEAGFALDNTRPVNRCGKPANPRVAFIDLNGDGTAEAHVADVDPSCYGKPGAYFAILARHADGNWRRVIAEDGIVGFERGRSAGWNNLRLTARDSGCPGTRRHNGTDYGTVTRCGAAAAAFIEGSRALVSATPAAANPAVQSTLTGSRVERLAQLLRNTVIASQTRTWDAALAAFPGARWQPRKRQPADWSGTTHTQSGTIDLGGAVYTVAVNGVADRVKVIELSSPPDDNLDWTPIERAVRAQGAASQTIGCMGPTGFGFVRLTAGRHQAVMHKFVNYGSGVPSVDFYAFWLDDPFQGQSEAQVASDRSLC